MNENGRTWPTLEMLELLKTGNIPQLENALAYLPTADTDEQSAFICALWERIKELETVA